ncbi:MAG TPA: cupin domain-containing protein [Ignavibacteria bacterium]|jgi:oxalate decarboxylase/phosphoglucose isomerase-like protein (cupin superfamily)
MNVLKAIVLTIVLTSASLFAQDWAKTDPKMNNILVDTTLLRATECIIEPGQKSGVHTHPAAFFYALTDGKAKVYYTDGQVETLELKAGDFGYGNPEKPHQTENIGDKTLRFLLVELKEHPYKSDK